MEENRCYARPNAEVCQVSKPQVETLLALFKTKAAAAKGEDEEEEAAGEACGFIEDFQSFNKHLYPHGGISFGEYGALIIQKALKKLAMKTGATNMRFWG